MQRLGFLPALVALLADVDAPLTERVALLSEVDDLLAEPGGIPSEADHLALDGGGVVVVVVVVVVHDFLPEKIFAQSKKGQPSAPLFGNSERKADIYISHMNRYVNDFRNYFAKITNFKYFCAVLAVFTPSSGVFCLNWLIG